jgi:hypothetical protein
VRIGDQVLERCTRERACEVLEAELEKRVEVATI